MPPGPRGPWSVPHGHDDDPRSRRLRRRPPERALDWVAALTGARVVGVRALRGGSSSAVHAVRIDDGGSRRTVVLRRYVGEATSAEAPGLVRREAAALGVLAGSESGRAVGAPGLVGADPDGTAAGGPALVMTRVPGRLVWTPRDLDRWLAGLAEAAVRIHDTPVPPGAPLGPFTPYEPPDPEPPGGIDRRLWDRALAVLGGPVGDPERCFIHRDHHPGNVLWLRGRLSGVVDWQAACVGPPSADVWHCRLNLLRRFGPEPADRFVAVWEAVSGRRYHPWAETVMLPDAIVWAAAGRPWLRRTLVDLLARRLAETGL